MYVFGRTDENNEFWPEFLEMSENNKNNFMFWTVVPDISLTSYAKIFGTFLGFRKGTPVYNEVRNVNVPGFLDPNFWFRMVIFPKIHQSSKILTECIALAKSIRKG